MFDFEVIERAIKNSHPNSTIYVGCDSKRKADMISYATVIIIHHEGNKGAMIYKNIETEPAYLSSKEGIRMRLMSEVYRAGECAMTVQPWVGDRGFEVHIDINPDPKHKSSVAYNEAKGTIFGYVGIEPVFKPDAFAASCAADYDAVRRAEKIAKRKDIRKAKRRERRSNGKRR